MKSIKEEIRYIMKRNAILSQLNDFAVGQNLLKVESDAFEEYCSYMEQNPRQDQTRLVKVQDLKGNVFLLKPDTTTNIIQQVIPRMEEGLELDLYYMDNVYRFSTRGQIESIRQFGVEMIGRKEIEADIQMVGLIQELLTMFEVDFVIELGNQQFVNLLIEQVTSEDEQINNIKQALIAKNSVEVQHLLQDSSVGIQLIFDAIMTNQNNLDLYRNVIQQENLPVELLTELDKIAVIIEQLQGNNVEVDLSLINEFDYYNGPIYKVYVKGYKTNILRGGRYDYLTKEFGRQTGALGFSLDVDRLIEEVVDNDDN